MFFRAKFIQALGGCFGKIPLHVCSFQSTSEDFHEHMEDMRLQLEAGSTTPWLRISQWYSKLTQDVTKYYFEGSHSSPQILAASHLELQQY